MEYIDDYESCCRTYATLLIYPKERHPDAITEELCISPTRTSVEGDSSEKTKVNGWFLSTQDIVESKDSRRHIDWLLDQIIPIKEKIISLQNNDTEVRISCFWESVSGNGGPTISPPQMRRLAELKLSVSWDVWFDGCE